MNPLSYHQVDPHAFTLLVVDDNPVNLKVVVDYLAAKGFRVLIARSGESGIQRALHGSPDLILLDILMPGINGFETCQRLKANPQTQDIPVIFMTTLADLGKKVRGFEVGGVDYVTKPFQQDELLMRVATHLRLSALQKAEKTLLLAERRRDLDELAYGIAQELRNPLMSISNVAYLLEITAVNPNPTTQNYLDAIKASVRQAEQIINGLLNLSPETSSDQTAVSAAFLVTSALSEQETPTNITIKMDIPANLPLAFVDADQIKTALNYLITNAYEAMPQGGELAFHTFVRQNHLHLRLSDTGPGISSENLEQLFEPLFTTRHKGIGLGLPIAQGLVQLNNGRILVKSLPGQGATFTLVLPLAKETPA